MKSFIGNIEYGLLFILILCNNIFAQYIPVFNYLDECIAILCSIIIIYNIMKYKKIPKMIILMILICFIGLSGNIIYNYQEEKIAILKEILAFSKIIIVFVAIYYYKKNFCNKNLSLSIIISKIYITIIFICGIVSLKNDIGLSYDLRNGILSYKFFYSHPTYLVYAIILMLVVLVANCKMSKANLFFQIEGLIVLFLTQRDKAFGFIVLYICVMLLINFPQKMKLWHIIMAFCGMLYISYDKILDYLNYSWSPRWALYMNGLKIMKDTFPFGSGFATFASSLSGEYYSLVYNLYDMSGRPGVSPDNYINLGDAQWPYYYAQFGILGLLIFIYILYSILKKTKELYSSSKMKLKALYLLLGYLFIASLVENVFTNESGVTAIVVLLLFLGPNNCEKNNINAYKLLN